MHHGPQSGCWSAWRGLETNLVMTSSPGPRSGPSIPHQSPPRPPSYCQITRSCGPGLMLLWIYWTFPLTGACFWCYHVFSLSWDDLKIALTMVSGLSGSALGSPGAACVVWAAVSGVNYDNMMNLRSKCLNSVVFCLLFSNSLASAWSSCGSSLWHEKNDPLPWIHCEWKESIQSKPVTGVVATTLDRKRKVIYFVETQLDLIFVKFRNQNQ